MMSDLFAPGIPAESIYSRRLRAHMVNGEGMDPGLRSGRDYVLLAPADHFQGEGVYLVELTAGDPALYRVQSKLGGRLRLSLDNPVFGDTGTLCTAAQFAEICLGIVVANIIVKDAHFLREVSR